MRLWSSQISGAVTLPLPQMVHALVQPSRSLPLSSSHSSSPSFWPFGAPPTQFESVVVVVDEVVTTVVVEPAEIVVDVVVGTTQSQSTHSPSSQSAVASHVSPRPSSTRPSPQPVESCAV